MRIRGRATREPLGDLDRARSWSAGVPPLWRFRWATETAVPIPVAGSRGSTAAATGDRGRVVMPVWVLADVLGPAGSPSMHAGTVGRVVRRRKVRARVQGASDASPARHPIPGRDYLRSPQRQRRLRSRLVAQHDEITALSTAVQRVRLPAAPPPRIARPAAATERRPRPDGTADGMVTTRWLRVRPDAGSRARRTQ